MIKFQNTPALPEDEKLRPLLDAIEADTGLRPHPATAHRWRCRGIGGVKLQTWKVGGKRLTTIKAVREFRNKGTAAADGEHLPSRTNRQRQSEIDRVEVELKDAGI